MKPHLVLFCSDTGLVYGPYTEAIDLRELGLLKVERATAIEFDNDSQSWQVLAPTGECLFSSPSRQACLTWEHEHLLKDERFPRDRGCS